MLHAHDIDNGHIGNNIDDYLRIGSGLRIGLVSVIPGEIFTIVTISRIRKRSRIHYIVDLLYIKPSKSTWYSFIFIETISIPRFQW